MHEAFVGRTRELELLVQALEASVQGRGRFVLLSGEPGIGKSRLCDELCARPEAEGALVVWGRAWEGDQTPPFWLLRQVFRRLEEAPSTRAAVASAGARFGALAAVLGDGESSMPAAEGARLAVSEACAELLRAAAAQVPLIVVFDDLQSADLGSLSALAFLARSLRDVRVLILATVRDVAFHPLPEVTAALAKASREATTLPLGRLDLEAVHRWVGEVAPALRGDSASIYERAEGNPLFVQELLAVALAGNTVSTQSLPSLGLGIGGALEAHLSLLNSAARGVLGAAAVLGREFSRRQVETVVANPAGVQAALEQGVHRRVLALVAEGAYRFSHVLLRDALVARLAPDERGALHRAAAKLAEDPAAALHHALLGFRPEDAGALVPLSMAAVRSAGRRFAFEDAAQFAERALGALRGVAAPVAVAELEIELGAARLSAGDTVACREACLRAANIAEAAGAGELVARAALVLGGEFSMQRGEEKIALLRRALAALPAGDSELRSKVLARLSLALVPPQPHEREEQRTLAEEAVAMGRRLHSDTALFFAMRLATSSFPERTPTRERFAQNAELINLAERLGEVNHVATTLSVQVGYWLELGDLDGARGEVARAERLLAPLSQAHYRWRVPLMRAALALVEGRFAQADAHGREALRHAQTAKSDLGLTMFAVHRQSAGFVTGDTFGYEEFEALTVSVLGPTNPMSRFFLAIPDAVLGRTERVRTALAELKAHGVEGVPGPTVLGWPCVAMGLREHADFFYQLASRTAENVPLNTGPGGFATIGHTAHLLGSLAALLGRTADAQRHFADALRSARALRSPPYLARLQLDWAALVAATDPAQARSRAEEALAVATAHQMPAWAEKARELLRGLEPAKAVPPRDEVTRARVAATLEREGALWVLSAGERRVSLVHARGLPYLEALLRVPHQEVHVLELEGRTEVADAGPMLDATARQQYRARVEALEEALEEATRFNDRGRIEKAREELEVLAGELSRGVGLGGRERRAASSAERARVNVQRRLRDVIKRVAEQDATLGEHLAASVRTGLYCVYAPTWPLPR